MNVLRPFLLALLAAAMVLTSGAMALARTAPDGQTLVICTGMGLSTVTLDANGDPMEAPPICPDCVVHTLAVLATAPQLNGPAESLLTLQPALFASETLSFEAVQAAARGPPLAV